MIDAEGLVVGRLASIIAMRLRGKHKPTYTPHMDCGDNVIVINADEDRPDRPQGREENLLPYTGYHRRHQGTFRQVRSWPGGFPERIVEKAVERMLPRGPLGRRQLGNLRVYPGPRPSPCGAAAHQLDIAGMNRKNTRGPPDGRHHPIARRTLRPQTGRGADSRRNTCRKLDKQGRAYATGKRKNAVARVWIKRAPARSSSTSPRTSISPARCCA